jgi:hypothetical protein
MVYKLLLFDEQFDILYFIIILLPILEQLHLLTFILTILVFFLQQPLILYSYKIQKKSLILHVILDFINFCLKYFIVI